MRQAFDNIVTKLKTDVFTQIAVHNNETFSKIIPATTGEDLKSKYGSVENFFDSIFKNGHKKIAIQEYRNNGSGVKKIGSVINFSFVDNAVQQSPTITTQNNNPFGLAGQVGLGFTDIINLTADSRDKVRLETENNYFKIANEELKKQVDELKEEKLATKYSADGKNSQNELILGLAQAFGPQLAGMFTKVPPTGLNAPEQPNYRDVSVPKQALFGLLSNPEFSDAMAQILVDIVENINTKPEFYEKLNELLNPVF